MFKRTDPVKTNYRRRTELALVLTLFLLTSLFTAFKRSDRTVVQKTLELEPLDIIEVPATEQQTRAQRPEMPSIPIETEDDDVPADATIDFTDVRWDVALATPPPPPEEKEEQVVFVNYDTPPEIIGGYDELAKNLVYPEIARKAGVEGRVLIWVLLSKEGKVLGTEVIKSLGNNGCDEAAIDAIKKVKWRPAYQRDQPVNVKVAITVNFRLK